MACDKSAMKSKPHTMLSMTQFCRVNKIAACGMSCFWSAGRKHVAEFYNNVLCRRENREWKARGADCRPIRADVKRSTERSNKMGDSWIRMSLLFFL